MKTITTRILFAYLLVQAAASESRGGAPPAITEEAHLVASDADAEDLFAWDLDLSGNTVVSGVPFEDGPGGLEQGAAYVFVRNGTLWTEEAKLRAPDGEQSDVFGESVAIDSNTIAVGSIFDDVGGSLRSGSAYVFVRSGTVWTLQAHLFASDLADDARFGESIALSGDTLAVGANWASYPGGFRQGAVYIFVRTGNVWSQQARLTASNIANNDEFGTTLSLQGDTLVTQSFRHDGPAGEDQGAVYIFQRNGAVWSQEAMLYPSAAHEFGYFGNVALDGNTLAVTMSTHNGAAGMNQGGVFVFTRSGSTWTEQAIVTAEDAAPETYFGAGTVDLQGGNLLVGQWPADGPNAQDQGAAYLFQGGGASWSQAGRITASDGALEDSLAITGALDGNRFVLGTIDDDVVAFNQGSAYVFRIEPVAPACCRGDMNGSSLVEVTDASSFAQVLLMQTGTADELCAADMDENGVRDSRDVQVFLNRLLSGGNCTCPSISQQPQNAAVCPAQPATFSVAVMGPASAYQWRKGGQELSDGGNISGAATDTLTINPAGTGDAGSYDVVITTGCGPLISSPADLTVASGPSISQQPPDTFACEGEPTSISVTASGVGILIYQWRKDGGPLSNGGRFSGADTATLQIFPVFGSDAGGYDCVITDDCGTITSATATLMVIGCG